MFENKINLQKPLREYTRRELTVAILALIAAGSLLCLLLAAPGLGQLFKYFRATEIKERKKLVRRMRSLAGNGYIAKSRGGFYDLTLKGKQLLTEEAVWSLTIPLPKKWDKKWRLVMFDIPVKKVKSRQALQFRLKELGFVLYQESVYVYPYPVEEIVTKIADFYQIRKHILFIEAERVEGQEKLIKHFKLV